MSIGLPHKQWLERKALTVIRQNEALIMTRQWAATGGEWPRPRSVEEAEDLRALATGAAQGLAAGPGPSGEGVAQRSPEPVANSAPRKSYAAMALANQRRHGTDGKFIPA